MHRRIAIAAMWAAVAAHGAEQSPLGLSYVETKDARLVYIDPTLAFITPHALRTFTNALAWQRRVLGWEPYEKTTVLLTDFSDYGNASATPLPRNTLRFDVAPVSHAFETYSASERMYSFMNHELTHVATTDIWSEGDRWWRRLFGGKVVPQAQHPETLLFSYLTTPRFNVPRWYAEGSAVFTETWMDGGLGRAQTGFYEMVFRAIVRDGARFYDPLGLESRGTRVDFQQGANAYLYGTRFFTYLSFAHSPEKVVAWLRRDATGRRHYADQFQHAFGITLDKAWADWIAFEHDFQRRNLEQVRAHPITPHRPLTSTAVGSASRVFYDERNDAIIAGFDYPGVVAHIGALNLKDGSIRDLADLKGPMLYKVTAVAYDGASRTVFYATDNLAHRDLRSINLDSGERRLLLKDARIGELVFDPSDRSLWGVRHQNGLATLVRIPHPYQEWNQVHTFGYGIVPYDLDISADGRRLSASVGEIGSQYLRVWDLAKVRAGDLKPLSEFRFGQSVPESFVFTRDGRYLYGSSYYTGVSNIFRYEVATGQVEAVSNAESGFFRPVPLADGRLLVLAYTAAGFVPAVIEPRVLKDVGAITFLAAKVAEKHPVVTSWTVPSPASVDHEKLVVAKGPYVPLANVAFQSAYPVLQGYKKYVGGGVHARFDDPLTLATLDLTFAYTPSRSLDRNERTHVALDFRYLKWHASASWNRPDFYDIFGPTIRSRRGTALKGGYDEALIFDEPRRLDFRSEVAFYDNLDALPGSQNIRPTTTRLTTAEAGLHYTDVRKSRGAVEAVKGVTGEAVASVNFAHGDAIASIRGSLDLGVPLPLANSSLWLRNAAGASGGDRDDPYANFFFGGFGNNYVDRRNERRYREHYAFPGFELNEIRGRSFSRHLVEANLPPYFFESVGTPAFHLNQMRSSVFASVLWTEPTRRSERGRYGNAGAQVDFRVSVLHWNHITLSFGYAVGYRGSSRAGNEWMASLKVMQ